MRTIRVVVVEPGKPATPIVVPDTLAAFRNIVGGNIEIFALEPLRKRGLHGYLNEDGKRLELAPNFVIEDLGPMRDVVVGTLVVSAGDADGDEVGLTEDAAAFAMAYFDALRMRQGSLPDQREATV